MPAPSIQTFGFSFERPTPRRPYANGVLGTMDKFLELTKKMQAQATKPATAAGCPAPGRHSLRSDIARPSTASASASWPGFLRFLATRLMSHRVATVPLLFQ